MQDAFEFLFCPAHGILRAENIAWAGAYLGNFLMWFKFWAAAAKKRIRI